MYIVEQQVNRSDLEKMSGEGCHPEVHAGV